MIALYVGRLDARLGQPLGAADREVRGGFNLLSSVGYVPPVRYGEKFGSHHSPTRGYRGG